MPSPVTLMLQAWSLTALLMLVFWWISRKSKNAGWVDMGWTLGLAVCIWFYSFSQDNLGLRHWLLIMGVTLWALRLANHLLVRFIIEAGREDKRYQKIRADWKQHQNLKFFFFFQFQAFLSVVLSICWLPSMYNSSLHLQLLEYMGIALWIAGFLCEVIADHQLKEFKSNPDNKGKTCQEGLWHYSRHPNYFGEWLMWVAYAVFALASPWGWIGLLPAALMYHFLRNVTGVPLAEEQSLQSRGEEYRRYQQTTSIFLPMPRRRLHS